MTALSALSLLLVLTTAMPAAAREPMALGVSVPNGRDMQVLDDFTADIGGNQPALWSIWSQWGSRGGQSSCVPGKGTCYFPHTALDGLADRGVMGVVWWEPIDPSKGFYQNQRWARHKKTYKLGRNDAYIRKWAQEAKKFGEDPDHPGAKIILRFAHEANGTWFPWTVGVWDNTPYTFKKFWRYVWNIFKQEGALPYVDFLWSVTKKSC
ncbi:MAG: glycosyl hydrolase, partial [Chloroflexota bacterium]